MSGFKFIINDATSIVPLALLFYLTFNIYEKYKKKIKIKKSDIIKYVIIIVVTSVIIIIHCYLNNKYIMHYILSIIVTIPMAILYFHHKIASILVEIIWFIIVTISVMCVYSDPSRPLIYNILTLYKTRDIYGTIRYETRLYQNDGEDTFANNILLNEYYNITFPEEWRAVLASDPHPGWAHRRRLYISDKIKDEINNTRNV